MLYGLVSAHGWINIWTFKLNCYDCYYSVRVRCLKVPIPLTPLTWVCECADHLSHECRQDLLQRARGVDNNRLPTEGQKTNKGRPDTMVVSARRRPKAGCGWLLVGSRHQPVEMAKQNCSKTIKQASRQSYPVSQTAPTAASVQFRMHVC